MSKESLPKVSVIVPVYNTESYLRTALDSLMAQTIPCGSMEILCVDDGSTDASPAILAEYEARSSKGEGHPLKVIAQPRNYGYGRAMNTGIEAARGEFVGFLEPDDFADPAMFEDLLAIAREHDADVVKSNYYDHFDDKGPDRHEEALRGHEYGVPLNIDVDETIVLIRACVWTAIYRRDFLVENRIRFNETPGASYQDTAFAFQVFGSARRLVLVHDAYVHYRLDNAASSVHSKKKEFAVYDELALIEAFVNADAERRAKLSSIAVYRGFWLHEWNLRRIVDEESAAIADAYISSRLRRAQAEGFLERRYFDDGEWAEVERLLAYRPPEALQDVERAREEVRGEYEASRSYRLGRALLAPARLLARRR